MSELLSRYQQPDSWIELYKTEGLFGVNLLMRGALDRLKTPGLSYEDALPTHRLLTSMWAGAIRQFPHEAKGIAINLNVKDYRRKTALQDLENLQGPTNQLFLPLPYDFGVGVSYGSGMRAAAAAAQLTIMSEFSRTQDPVQINVDLSLEAGTMASRYDTFDISEITSVQFVPTSSTAAFTREVQSRPSEVSGQKTFLVDRPDFVSHYLHSNQFVRLSQVDIDWNRLGINPNSPEALYLRQNTLVDPDLQHPFNLEKKQVNGLIAIVKPGTTSATVAHIVSPLPRKIFHKLHPAEAVFLWAAEIVNGRSKFPSAEGASAIAKLHPFLTKDPEPKFGTIDPGLFLLLMMGVFTGYTLPKDIKPTQQQKLLLPNQSIFAT